MKAWILVFLFFFQVVQAADLSYLKPESIVLADIPSPPVLNSTEDLADLNEVLHWQQNRTEAECARASFEAAGFATSFFGEPYGPLTQAEAERLVDFQEKLFNEVNYYSRILKRSWSRLRPFLRDSEITPCIPLHHSNAYPSGHAAISYVASRSFALLYPEYKEALYQRAEEIALGRVIGGVHHPLDIVAGKVLGQKVFEALIEQPEFHTDLRKLIP